MKKLIFMILLWSSGMACAMANETVGNDNISPNSTLFEELTNVKKKTDKLNLFMYMKGSFGADFNDGFQDGKFKMDQFRIEAKGNLNDWLFYRYRQRLNRPNDGQEMIDNMPTSIDYAFVTIKFNKRAELTIGKHSAFFGGIEFDQNPIDVYMYSDKGSTQECFLTGVNFCYYFNQNHHVNLQVMNNRSGSFESTYGVTEPEEGKVSDLKDTKMPLLYNVNWNGTFNDVFNARWSATVSSETKGHLMYYYAMGNELKLGKWYAFADLMYSKESLDRSGIISDIVGRPYGHNVGNASYRSVVAQCNYRFLPKWQFGVKGMRETSWVDKTTEIAEKGKYRTSYGYVATLEYFPMETNLHFFVAYMGRTYNYTSLAKAFGHSNYDTHRVATGFVWNLPLF